MNSFRVNYPPTAVLQTNSVNLRRPDRRSVCRLITTSRVRNQIALNGGSAGCSFGGARRRMQAFVSVFVQIKTVAGSGIGIDNGTRNRIENGTKIRIETEIATDIENETQVGNEGRDEVRIKSVTWTEIESDTELRLVSVNKKDVGLYSMSMLTELRALTRWIRDLQERVERSLSKQLVSNECTEMRIVITVLMLLDY
ncbi:hypothetical protein EVAR_82707_1 [Eumeta japonica]|uniref:Uncharacterized protein n=1 Tax=Eumeta variegata TaxID=151549 RepID=A0A4C1YCY3_EUMVA|nr:hypothetical protein EVAR_82707_1 [Eumeta japonica]